MFKSKVEDAPKVGAEIADVEPTAMMLTELEAEQLEKHAVLVELRKMEKAMLGAQAKVFELTHENFLLKIKNLDVSRLQLKQDLDKLDARSKKESLQKVELQKRIKDRLDIGCERFGYNPDTLEVVLE